MTQIKKRYAVYAKFTTYGHVFINAYDEEDAYETAGELDPDLYSVDRISDFETYDAEILYSLDEI